MTLSVHAWLTGTMMVLLPDIEQSGRDGLQRNHGSRIYFDVLIMDSRYSSSLSIHHQGNIFLKSDADK